MFKSADVAKDGEEHFICVGVVLHCKLIGSVCVCVCLQRKEKQRLNFSVQLIAQGAFSGMIHEEYLTFRKKSEDHRAVVTGGRENVQVLPAWSRVAECPQPRRTLDFSV